MNSTSKSPSSGNLTEQTPSDKIPAIDAPESTGKPKTEGKTLIPEVSPFSSPSKSESEKSGLTSSAPTPTLAKPTVVKPTAAKPTAAKPTVVKPKVPSLIPSTPSAQPKLIPTPTAMQSSKVHPSSKPDPKKAGDSTPAKLSKSSPSQLARVSPKKVKPEADSNALVPIRTLLSQFAVEFCDELDPVCTPLSKLEGLISDLPHESNLHDVLPELRDVRHHIQLLLEKVKNQQAYVLIFGPLKSGKSTLMNAICASYVSEVTTLPAYPCLVNISYSKKSEYCAVQYDGKSKKFTDQDDLHKSIQRAHVDLTHKLREVEGAGKAFDPVVHMPSAFRKIDIKLTIPELATSSAVLVDTPGLYSRMKFGYDQMTRDFRNTAACAIFVVKSDNLFLEQVFEEFTELLDLFSRIFLIVNLDTRKQDLSSDGELVPSLEQKDPQKIIDAFRNLAMSAPLKEAVDDGRLRIYPVDLLSAASGRIRANKESDKKKAAQSSQAQAIKGLPVKNQPVKDQKALKVKKMDMQSVESFENLRGDLINFLNSNDYLKSFLVDSVRRGASLMATIQKTLKNPSFTKIKANIDQLEVDKKVLERKHKAVDNLTSTDWHALSSNLSKELEAKTSESVEKIQKASGPDLEEILNLWWKGDTSLHDLKELKLLPYFKKAAQSYTDELSGLMAGKTANKNAGLEISGSLTKDLETMQISLHTIVEKALKVAKPENLVSQSKLSVSAIPVKRSFLDWIMFRGTRRVRANVFGNENEPSQVIPSGVKDKRLGETARDYILSQCREDFAAIWTESTLSLPKDTVKKYVVALSEDIADQCGKLDEENQKETIEKEKFIAANAAVVKETASIGKVVTAAAQFIKKSYPLPAWPDSQSKKKK